MLFGLLSIVGAAIGMAALLGAASRTTAEQTFLVRLNQATSEITTRLESGDEDGIQSAVKELTDSNELLFCAVINGDGLAKAHSAEGFIGHNSPANFSGAHEYWISLRREQQSFGMLQVSVPVQLRSGHSADLLKHNAGMALAFPALLLLAGY